MFLPDDNASFGVQQQCIDAIQVSMQHMQAFRVAVVLRNAPHTQRRVIRAGDEAIAIIGDTTHGSGVSIEDVYTFASQYIPGA